MDFTKILQEEVQKKRKLIAVAKDASPAAVAPAKKYVRRGDLESVHERLRRDEEDRARRAREDAERAREAERATKERSRSASPAVVAPAAVDNGGEAADRMVPNDEVIKRLRARGEPIRLFGETDRQRMNRLRLLESQDADQPGEAGQANEFRRAMEATEQRLVKEALQKQAGLEDDDEKRRRAAEDALLDSVDTSPISLQLLQEDEDRNIYLVSVFFRRLLRDWGRAMDRMPDEQKRSREGKLLQTNYRQSQEFLQPFFRRLKTKTIEADVLARVTEMAVYLQQREYQKANNQYLQLSIGNAPWPIGVTMVGIHERSGREKIFASKVAHVLNDEATRKWIQSLKRVMTWAQEEYPPDDVSKRMG